MASTMVQSSASSASENFVRGRALYKETTTTKVTATTSMRQTETNDIPIRNNPHVLNRQNSSLYTGSIFAAFNSEIQVILSL